MQNQSYYFLNSLPSLIVKSLCLYKSHLKTIKNFLYGSLTQVFSFAWTVLTIFKVLSIVRGLIQLLDLPTVKLLQFSGMKWIFSSSEDQLHLCMTYGVTLGPKLKMACVWFSALFCCHPEIWTRGVTYSFCAGPVNYAALSSSSSPEVNNFISLPQRLSSILLF